MRVYIVNLDKYNKGERTGVWFRPPIDFEHMREVLALGPGDGGYMITDCELPFPIGHFASIDELNYLCDLVEGLEGEPFYAVLEELLRSGEFNGLEGLVERKDDIIHHAGCSEMEDIAREKVENGEYGEVSEKLKAWYIDYEAIARDEEINGTFIGTSKGIFELRYR